MLCLVFVENPSFGKAFERSTKEAHHGSAEKKQTDEVESEAGEMWTEMENRSSVFASRDFSSEVRS